MPAGYLREALALVSSVNWMQLKALNTPSPFGPLFWSIAWKSLFRPTLTILVRPNILTLRLERGKISLLYSCVKIVIESFTDRRGAKQLPSSGLLLD